MAGEVHGSRTRVHAAGFDLTRNLRSASTEETFEVPESTTFGVDAKAYAPSPIADGTFSAEGLYDLSDGQVRRALEAMAGVNDALLSVWRDTDAVGKPGEGLAGIETAKSVSTEIGDLAMISMEMQSSLGVEDLVSLHPMTDEAAGAPTFAGVDEGTATTDGAAGYLQAWKAPPGVTLDITVQHSTDGVTWVDLIVFGQVAGAAQFSPRFARIVVPGQVERHVRAIATVAGGPATFAVAICREPANP